ncbi:hypothetical protein C1O51_01715 [Akkermansia muciniphila]|nr:hypothetical protein C1O51_01715 [Akkermansia muciniphila]
MKKLQREQQKDAKDASRTFVQGLLMKTGKRSSPSSQTWPTRRLMPYVKILKPQPRMETLMKLR